MDSGSRVAARARPWNDPSGLAPHRGSGSVPALAGRVPLPGMLEMFRCDVSLTEIVQQDWKLTPEQKHLIGALSYAAHDAEEEAIRVYRQATGRYADGRRKPVPAAPGARPRQRQKIVAGW